MKGVIRPWSKADLPSIRDVLWRTWTAAYGAFIPIADLKDYFDTTYQEDALALQLTDPDRQDLLGEQQGAVEAVLRVKLDRPAARTYVSSLYVLPECQGSGWGHRLMGEAARIAVDQGQTSLWLGVMVQNTPAVEWYRRHGYRVVEQQPFTMGSTSVPHYIGWLPANGFGTHSKRPADS